MVRILREEPTRQHGQARRNNPSHRQTCELGFRLDAERSRPSLRAEGAGPKAQIRSLGANFAKAGRLPRMRSHRQQHLCGSFNECLALNSNARICETYRLRPTSFASLLQATVSPLFENRKSRCPQPFPIRDAHCKRACKRACKTSAKQASRVLRTALV